MSELTFVDVAEDWVALYVDGDLHEEGHSIPASWVVKAAGGEVLKVDVDPDKFVGAPDTLEELKEKYDTRLAW